MKQQPRSMTSRLPGPSGVRTTRLQRIVTVTALVSMQCSLMMPAQAAIDLAQKPLIASTGNMPKPNLMLTVDTSASMSFRHMPETSTTVNGVTITVLGESRWFHHPSDTYENDASGTSFNAGTMWARKDLAADSWELLEQIKYRSPDVNTIYYNPEIRYRPWPKVDGTRFSEGNIQKAYIDPLAQGGNDTHVDLSTTFTIAGVKTCTQYFFATCIKTELAKHHPGIYYRLKSNTANPTKADSYKLYDVNDADTGPYTRYPARDDCTTYTDRCSQAEEQQNFANWFVYYRTRMLTTKAALSEAFYQADNSVRVGWTTLRQALHNRWEDGRSPIIQGVKDLDTAHRTKLLEAIQGYTKPDTQAGTKAYFASDDGTPLRLALDQVGKYFQRSANYSPWEDNPEDIPATPSSAKAFSGQGSICRRSYNMLTTDGYYNSGPKYNELDYIANEDRVGDLDSGQDSYEKYTRSTPYRDHPDSTGYSNTLADFALKYWATDLSTLVDGIKPTSYKDRTTGQVIENPATWQHLTQFTVGFGVSGKLPNTKATYDSLVAGDLSWPDPLAAEAHKIDDLWHAAVNSRGAFYNVRTAGELEAAVRDMLNKANTQPLREAGVATSATALQTADVKFVPEYDKDSWTGNLYAYKLQNGKVVPNTTGGDPDKPDAKWIASDSLPAAPARNIKTSGTQNTTAVLVPFTASGMGDTNWDLMNLIKQDAASEALVNYIRGDRSNEGDDSGQFRERDSVLADIINSTPVFAKDGLDVGYGDKYGYADFLKSKATRPDPMVFVGSNGGMLHAFDAGTGTERFAFVPRGVLPYLYKLAEQGYAASTSSHRYYVDGPLTEADAMVGDQWRNLLIGSLGAGGKGLFALGLPVQSTEGSEPTLMWDLTYETSANAYIGNIFSKAEVGRLPDGSWKVFVGNGINSSEDKAALLMIDVASGVVTVLPAGTETGNGLTGISVVRDANKDIVAVYGGDLLGNLWRFEYNNGAMVQGYGGKPLYKASMQGVPQPITAAPVVTQGDQGQVILFGTGRLLAESDRPTTQVQTFYGVVDKTAANQSSNATTISGDAVVARSDLVTQTISAYTSTTESKSPYTFLNVTSNPQTSDSKGWALELIIPPVGSNSSADAPRVIYEPILVGDFVLITAISPAPDAAECSTSNGRAYDFLLPATTGAQYDKPVFDTNGSGLVTTDGSDGNAAGAASTSMGRRTILTGNRDGDGKRDISIQTGNGDLAGADWLIKKTSAILDRVWQRIQPPPDRSAK